ncbi:MAG TPA: TonB-dependent receptor [Steroidobacter sp.]|uniref:TonB-dependent receptor n=1 Tax=Steroidobacter sp. TaxID=1978227 RepID=UPI002EDA167B
MSFPQGRVCAAPGLAFHHRLFICGASLLAVATPAAAQSERVSQSVGGLEEVVVTAQKRSESLQDVPIAISAVGAEEMVRSRTLQVRDLQAQIPNVGFGVRDNKDTTISIRGIADNTRNVGYDARAGVYVDGVYVGQSQAMNQGLLDLDRVEVLRGPQGTLFGKNTVSGAINLITRKPDAETRVELGLDVGNLGLFAQQALVNVPLVSDRLFLKVSGRNERSDGYIKNLHNGDDLNGENTTSGRVQARWLATEQLEINLSADVLREHPHGVTNAVATGGPAFEETGSVRRINMDAQGDSDRTVEGAALTIDYSLGSGRTLTSVTAYRGSDATRPVDEDYSSADSLASDFADDTSQFTQEFRLASTSERLDYVVGLYYMDQDLETRHGATGGVDLGLPGYRVVTSGTSKNQSYAVFIDGNYHITDDLTLTAGGRYTRETKDIAYSINGGPPLFMNLDSFKDSLRDSSFTPRVGLSYEFVPDVMGYVMVSRGAKSGGWNADFITTTEQIAFGPEEATNYEAGLKSTLFDRRLRINAAIFNTKYTDYQVSQFVQLSTGGTLITLTNAGEVTSRGLELEMAASLTPQLQLNANLGLLEAKFDSFKDGGGPGVHYDGKTLPYAPKVSGGLALDYRYEELSAGALDFRVDYSYKGYLYSNPNNGDQFRSPGYGLVGVRAGFRTHDSKWGVYAWAQNLTDKLYSNFNGLSFLGVPRADIGPPRTYGLELRAKF